MPEGQLARSTELDLGELLQTVIRDNEIEADAKQVSLSLKYDASQNHCLNGNKVQLQSVFENIVRNAIHYTNPNSEVKVNLEHSNGSLIVSVEDHGPGVPEADLANIFEPF